MIAGTHRYLADEPVSVGGNGSGPSPYEYLLAGLGACTSMTIRLYADLKKLPLERVAVRLKHDKIHAADCENCETKEGKIDRIDREITLDGELTAEQRTKLMEIADKCPVHRTLHGEIDIRTQGYRMIVIVGAGQAAAQLVLSLRQGGYKEPIRMIGDEPYAPYQRPPLSKKFLTERPPADTLYFRPEKFWGEQGVTATTARRSPSIDRAAKRVTFADGHAEYETLFLSTGTRARDMPLPGARLDWRVLAAQDRRCARAACADGCRQAHRHRRRRLYRTRGRGRRAQ